MRILVIFLVILGTSLAFPQGKDPSEKEFEKEFKKAYLKKGDEEKAEKNLKKEEEAIDEENEKFAKGEANFEEELEPWDDLSKEEFEKEKTGRIPQTSRGMGLIYDPETRFTTAEDQAFLDEFYANFETERGSIPASYDARAYGIVTAAKNQGSCGSCAAFAGVGAEEICYRKAGAPSKGLDISEQQLVDCKPSGANGCYGATPHAYGTYRKSKPSAMHEYKYPYLNTNPKLVCPSGPYWNPGAKVTNYAHDYKCTADKMKKMIVASGSAVTGIYASDSGFGNYKSGILDKFSSTKCNHAVVAVGWGKKNGIDYWIIKNSWGTKWGKAGFIKVKMGTGGVGGDCGVYTCAKNGKQQALPPAPPPPTYPASCDLKKYLGDVTGNWIISGISSTCAHGKCTPKGMKKGASPCKYYCGRAKC